LLMKFNFFANSFLAGLPSGACQAGRRG